VPLDKQCGAFSTDKALLARSHFTVSNLKIVGSVVQGPTPTRCASENSTVVTAKAEEEVHPERAAMINEDEQLGVNATDGQCKFSSYEFCCGVGKACMCNMAKGGPKQCLSASYDYCCYKPHVVGHPCDCSKGPHSGPIECKIINLACSKLFAKAVTSVVGCTLDDALVVATCEAVAMGPEDPLGDACAAILGITVEAGCVAMVNKGAAFTAAKCKSVAGCGSEESMVVV